MSVLELKDYSARLRPPGNGTPWLLRVYKSLHVPNFRRFLRHLSVSSLLLHGLFACRSLSGGRRQGGNPSYRRPDRPPGQMALGQRTARARSAWPVFTNRVADCWFLTFLPALICLNRLVIVLSRTCANRRPVILCPSEPYVPYARKSTAHERVRNRSDAGPPGP